MSYHSVRFVAIAAIKPLVSKLSSLAEHKANPLITGINERFTYKPVSSPEMDIKVLSFKYK